MNLCPVCLNTTAKTAGLGGGFDVQCPNCGNFKISEEAWDDELDPQTGPGHTFSEICRKNLSHRIRSLNDPKTSRGPKIDSAYIIKFREDNCPGPSPADQANNIIRLIGDEVAKTGTPCLFADNVTTVVGSLDQKALYRLVKQLVESGLVLDLGKEKRELPGGRAVTSDVYDLSLEGWEVYESKKKGEIDSKKGFVALQFGDPILEALVKDHIKPEIKNRLGYAIFDMRDVARAGVIDNLMRAQIRDSTFVLVDLTHDNSGAYWEAGYAEGLGKPVIYVCEKSKFDDARTHFDTNHCTTVLWDADKPSEFVDELIATLRRSLDKF